MADGYYLVRFEGGAQDVCEVVGGKLHCARVHKLAGGVTPEATHVVECRPIPRFEPVTYHEVKSSFFFASPEEAAKSCWEQITNQSTGVCTRFYRRIEDKTQEERDLLLCREMGITLEELRLMRVEVARAFTSPPIGSTHREEKVKASLSESPEALSERVYETTLKMAKESTIGADKLSPQDAETLMLAHKGVARLAAQTAYQKAKQDASTRRRNGARAYLEDFNIALFAEERRELDLGPDAPMTASRYLRARRLISGVPIRDVAMAVGLDLVEYAEIERGIKPCPPELAGPLSEAIPGLRGALLVDLPSGSDANG